MRGRLLCSQHVFFIHKIKNMTSLRQLWRANLRERYDYDASARERLRDLAATNVTDRLLHPDPSSACTRTRLHPSCTCEHQQTARGAWI